MEIIRLGLSCLAIHFFIDWIAQKYINKIFAKTKFPYSKKEPMGLFFHCSYYTLGFLPVFYCFQISFLWLALIFLSHCLIDGLSANIKMKTGGYPIGRFFPDITKYIILGKIALVKDILRKSRFQMLDQFLHLLILGIILSATIMENH